MGPSACPCLAEATRLCEGEGGRLGWAWPHAQSCRGISCTTSPSDGCTSRVSQATGTVCPEHILKSLQPREKRTPPKYCCLNSAISWAGQSATKPRSVFPLITYFIQLTLSHFLTADPPEDLTECQLHGDSESPADLWGQSHGSLKSSQHLQAKWISYLHFDCLPDNNSGFTVWKKVFSGNNAPDFWQLKIKMKKMVPLVKFLRLRSTNNSINLDLQFTLYQLKYIYRNIYILIYDILK